MHTKTNAQSIVSDTYVNKRTEYGPTRTITGAYRATHKKHRAYQAIHALTSS